MAQIALIDDDLHMDLIVERLRFRGHDAYRICSVADALNQAERILTADLVVLDIIMPWPEDRVATGLAGPRTAGMEVLAEIRRTNQDLPVIAYSATEDGTVRSALADDRCTSFLSKYESHSNQELIERIDRTLGLPAQSTALQPFIVHGHNNTMKLALKNYLQNTLHLPEPIILHEQPNLGRTTIEKLEDYAGFSSIVFVLLTQDDTVASPGDDDDTKRRARQNVIFEMGYFLGILGRRSGRILLLHYGPLDIPSDVSGLVYIDISDGIDAASEKIRREVNHVSAQ